MTEYSNRITTSGSGESMVDLRWVNVEEELPPLGKDVLVWAENKCGPGYEVGQKYMAIDRLVTWKDLGTTSFRTDRFYGKVIAWHLLPEAPNV